MNTQTIRAFGACAIAILLVVTGTCLAIQQAGDGKAGEVNTGLKSLTIKIGVNFIETGNGILYRMNLKSVPETGCPSSCVPVTIQGVPDCVCRETAMCIPIMIQGEPSFVCPHDARPSN
jgi:hypothetical protein